MHFQWGEVMRRNVAAAYGAWLGWTTISETDRTIGVPVPTPKQLVAYAAYLTKNFADSTVLHRIVHLERATALLDPKSRKAHFRAVISNLKAQGIRTKNKRLRIQEPASLIALGLEMMENFRPGGSIGAARRYRDGLQIALLAQRPLRPKNFAALQLDTHVVKLGGSWWISIDGSEMKKGRSFERPFPLMLVEHLEYYLAHVRPVLLQGATTDGLWISSQGNSQSQRSIFYGVTRATQEHFGKSVSPHLVRDCVQTSVAIHDPANVAVASTMLGNGIATAQDHYNQARSIDASRTYSTTIDRLRRRLCRSQVQPRKRRLS